jgi:transcriptional regulator with XRE-family HTH domain
VSAATGRVLDTGKLWALVGAVAAHRQISMRHVAAETGLSPSTLTRIGQGQKPDADGLLTLLAWLRVDAGQVSAARDGAAGESLASEVVCVPCGEAGGS